MVLLWLDWDVVLLDLKLHLKQEKKYKHWLDEVILKEVFQNNHNHPLITLNILWFLQELMSVIQEVFVNIVFLNLLQIVLSFNKQTKQRKEKVN